MPEPKASPNISRVELATGPLTQIETDEEMAPFRTSTASGGSRTSQARPSEGRLSLEIEPVPEERPRAGNAKMIAFVSVLVIFLIFAALHEKQIEEKMKEFVKFCQTLGYGAAVLICVATFLASLAMVPCFPLMLASGTLFATMYGPEAGMLVGTISVFTGLWVGSVAAFILGRYVFADFAAHAAKESQLLIVVSGMIKMQGRRIVFLARMTPIIPGEVFNYACSAIPTLSAWDYGIGCIGSILPVFVWVWAGAQVAPHPHHEDGEETEHHGRRSTILMGLNVVGMVVLFFEFWRAYSLYKRSLEAEELHGSVPASTEEPTLNLADVP